MSQRVKTLLAVIFLTVVAWTAIDFEIMDEFEYVVHDISVQSPRPDYRVKVIRPADGRISVVLAGPRGQINEFKSAPEDSCFRYVLSEQELHEGRLTIDVQEGFEHLRDRRITVKRAEPQQIEVTVDRLIRLEKVSVNVSVAGAVLAEGNEPQVEPKVVKATVSEADFAHSGVKDHFATARVDLSEVEIPEGGKITRNVTLDKHLDGNADIPADFEPDTVSVTLIVESPLMTKTLQGVPVSVSAPPQVMGKYEVIFREPETGTRNLKISGPRDKVRALLPGDVRIYLEITADDKPADEPGLLREPRIFLPPGISLVERPPQIRFNLKPRGEKLPGG